MSASILGRRYAHALIELAADAAEVERIARDLRDFTAMWDQNRDLRAAFENPSVPQQSRRDILRELAAQANMHPHVRDLLLLLSDRQRMRHVPEVADAFAAMAEARSGRARAEVTTATALPPAFFSELERVLRELTGKQIVLVQRVDPTLIGGVVTRIGDQVFDGSIKSRLSELKEELLQQSP